MHGIASDIAGEQQADPPAAISPATMLCDHLGMTSEAARIERAIAGYLPERYGESSARSTAEAGGDFAGRVSG